MTQPPIYNHYPRTSRGLWCMLLVVVRVRIDGGPVPDWVLCRYGMGRN